MSLWRELARPKGVGGESGPVPDARGRVVITREVDGFVPAGDRDQSCSRSVLVAGSDGYRA
jgi:hypothetical protein